jgi:hypothetical protein
MRGFILLRLHFALQRSKRSPVAGRAMVAAKIANLDHGGDRKTDQGANLPLEPAPAPLPVARAAEMLNVSSRSVGNARAVRDRAIPELIEKVEQGAWSRGVTVSPLYRMCICQPLRATNSHLAHSLAPSLDSGLLRPAIQDCLLNPRRCRQNAS